MTCGIPVGGGQFCETAGEVLHFRLQPACAVPGLTALCLCSIHPLAGYTSGVHPMLYCLFPLPERQPQVNSAGAMWAVAHGRFVLLNVEKMQQYL